MNTYHKNDAVWKETQAFLPPRNRLTPETMPEEYYLSLNGVRLAANGCEVICPDLPLYGYTEHDCKVSYETYMGQVWP